MVVAQKEEVHPGEVAKPPLAIGVKPKEEPVTTEAGEVSKTTSVKALGTEKPTARQSLKKEGKRATLGKREEKGEEPPPADSKKFRYTYLLMSANEALEKGDLQRALRLYQKYAKKFVKNEKVWNNIGAIYLRTGRYKEALYALKRAYRLNSTDPEIEVNLAIAYWERGEQTLAEEVARRLVNRDNLSTLATYNLTLLLLKMGKKVVAYSLIKREEGRHKNDSLLLSLNPYFRDMAKR